MKRSYEDYKELGRVLKQSRDMFQEASQVVFRMFPQASHESKNTKDVAARLEALRSLLDSNFVLEFQEKDIPQGEPRYPIYPGQGLKGVS